MPLTCARGRARCRKASPANAAITEAHSTPILAWLSIAGSGNARLAMNSDIVKPIPASRPTPIRPCQLAPRAAA